MNKAQYTELVSQELDGMKELIRAKNADYSHGDDPFANFRLSSRRGVDPLIGLLIRMDDKWQRIDAFMKRGELSVKDEGVKDAFRDLIGYSCLAIGMLTEREEDCKNNALDYCMAEIRARQNDAFKTFEKDLGEILPQRK